MTNPILAALLVACGCATAYAADTDALWAAVCQVETGGDASAYNESEQAAGIAQIRPICLRDCNRIAGYERWTLADRYDVAESRAMFELYTAHYTRRIGWTAERAARCWNGGPTGWKKESTLGYWRKVQELMP